MIKKILIFGDSHSVYFTKTPDIMEMLEIIHEIEIKVVSTRGSTILGFGKRNSTLNTRNLFIEHIKEEKPDCVVFALGQVDVELGYYYRNIVKGENIPTPGIPESFKVLVKELQSLALDVSVIKDNEVVDIKDGEEEDMFSLDINMSGSEDFKINNDELFSMENKGDKDDPLEEGETMSREDISNMFIEDAEDTK